jgi:pseudaminic acid synthase
MQIQDLTIDDSSKTFIVAELSANHNQKKELAFETIRAAAKAGVDAIKLQTYTPDTITLNCRNEYFKLNHGTPWDGQYLYDLYQQAYTPWEWHKELFETAQEEGLICFSTPFDHTAVDFLEELGNPAYKIASFEIQDIPLIRYAASKGKPIILSTGIAELKDIELAVKTCREAGNEQIALLKCTSSYPAPVEDANLKTIPNMKETFKVVPGLSDHTLGSVVPITSIPLGAKIIEKHIILDHNQGGPDSQFSMDPDEFGEMVKQVRAAEKALGTVNYELSDQQKRSREITGRSLFVTKDLKKGDVLTEDNVRSVRPGYGLHPKHLVEVVGNKVNQNVEKGTPLFREYLED